MEHTDLVTLKEQRQYVNYGIVNKVADKVSTELTAAHSLVAQHLVNEELQTVIFAQDYVKSSRSEEFTVSRIMTS